MFKTWGTYIMLLWFKTQRLEKKSRNGYIEIIFSWSKSQDNVIWWWWQGFCLVGSVVLLSTQDGLFYRLEAALTQVKVGHSAHHVRWLTRQALFLHHFLTASVNKALFPRAATFCQADFAEVVVAFVTAFLVVGDPRSLVIVANFTTPAAIKMLTFLWLFCSSSWWLFLIEI